MNDTKTKTVFEERDELRRENERLKAKLAATEEALAQVQRESAELRTKYEAARKVADAAVAYQVVESAAARIPGFKDGESTVVLMDAGENALSALIDAVREYRALNEPPALSPSKQSAFDRGIASAEKVGEMWETN